MKKNNGLLILLLGAVLPSLAGCWLPDNIPGYRPNEMVQAVEISDLTQWTAGYLPEKDSCIWFYFNARAAAEYTFFLKVNNAPGQYDSADLTVYLADGSTDLLKGSASLNNDTQQHFIAPREEKLLIEVCTDDKEIQFEFRAEAAAIPRLQAGAWYENTLSKENSRLWYCLPGLTRQPWLIRVSSLEDGRQGDNYTCNPELSVFAPLGVINASHFHYDYDYIYFREKQVGYSVPQSVVPEQDELLYLLFQPDGYSPENYGSFGFMVEPLNLPVAPQNLNISWENNTARLSWDPVSGANEYYIYRGDDGQPLRKLNSRSVTATTYTDDTVTVLHSYIYQVVAVCAGIPGESSMEFPAVFSLTDYIPRTPEASYGESRLIISWSPVEGVDGYRIYRSDYENSGYVQTGGDLDSAQTSYEDPETEYRTTYYYKITCFLEEEESQFSRVDSGFRFKYGPDIYEEDDNYQDVYQSTLYSSETESHTLDWAQAEIGGDRDCFIIHSARSFYNLRITFLQLDLNGNSRISLKAGNTVHITTAGTVVELEYYDFLTEDNWRFSIINDDTIFMPNTAMYRIRLELIDPYAF